MCDRVGGGCRIMSSFLASSSSSPFVGGRGRVGLILDHRFVALSLGTIDRIC